MKRKEQYADEIIEMLEHTKGGAWASNINLNTKDRVIEVCQNVVDSWSGRKFKDHCTTSPQALEQTKWIPYDGDDDTTWPKDGTWNIFTNGKRCSVERFKIDALNHFYPNGRWFELDDVIAWMPLPPCYEPQESEDKE